MYNLYVVVCGEEMEVETTDPLTEEEAIEAMREFKVCAGLWIALANGGKVSISAAAMANTYFIVKPIKG